MILDDATLLKLLSKSPNEKLFKAIKDDTDKLLMHIKGVDLKKYIEKTGNFEKEDAVAIRLKYAISNKSLFARVHRPKDKIFNAKGGSVYYNMDDKKAAEFSASLNTVVNGFSLRKWLQTFWLPATEYDPMGLIYVEIDNKGVAYPTYKSVKDIYDYQMNGRKVEYVIFEKDARIDKYKRDNVAVTGKIYRVVDDILDRLVIVTQDGIKTLDQYINYFFKVPAMIISETYDPVKGYFISTDDEVIEIADQFLQQGSVKNIYKNYFGFPIHWRYASSCPDCKGTGKVGGNNCTSCKGSGKKSKNEPGDSIEVPVPQSNDQPRLAPELAGYISPDIEGWTKMDEELKMLEDIIFRTRWGTAQAEQSENNTATGKFIDTQPVIDALSTISDAAEKMETFITDLIGELKYAAAYGGASVTYGKRFIIESPDDIWKKVQAAVKDGAPVASCYDLYNDYLQSRYSANSLEMQKQLKLAKIEPLPFLPYEHLGRITNFPLNILLKKYYFEGWLNSKTDQEIQNTELSKLQADFAEYCEEQDEARIELDKQNALDAQGIGGQAAQPVSPAPGKVAAPGKTDPDEPDPSKQKGAAVAGAGTTQKIEK